MKIEFEIQQCFKQHQEVLAHAEKTLSATVALAAQALVTCFQNGNKILCCGNGGSACDADHFTCEMVNRFLIDRHQGLPVVSLPASIAVLSAVANDYSYDEIFAKQVQALGCASDFLFAISTSGDSKNILRAIEAAHAQDMRVLALTGDTGGKLKQLLKKDDFLLAVPSNETPRIQEIHILVIHILCALIEQSLFNLNK
jgi:phosphoheptose isomerase